MSHTGIFLHSVQHSFAVIGMWIGIPYEPPRFVVAGVWLFFFLFIFVFFEFRFA